ncbi:MAG: sporulation protein YabP [Oscillospiraceae bacterium]|nr:sporulation protein YabP [Candidatus Ruminococcus equi]
MQEINKTKPHSLMLDNRKSLSMTGVVDVSGFDDQTVNVKTALGTLVVKGSSLHINKLNLESGDVSIDGEINSLQYLSNNRDKSLRSRLLK